MSAVPSRYAVAGNPVEHSQSPFIHAEFARQTGESVAYERLLCPIDGFAATVHAFAAAGASVVGVSLDSIERLNVFSADPDYCAGKLAVASDGDGRIARAFGLHVSGAEKGATDTRGKEIDHGFSERTTFVVRRDGTVAAAVGGVSPEANVAKALELVRKLSATR